MQKSISIIITVYNRERYLPDAIKSILVQTRSDFELLIWDDGSTDNSVKVANYFAKHDQRVRVIAAPHLGQTPALKAAINETTAPYFGWVDSDDILAPKALAETASILDKYSQVGLVYTDYQVIDEHNKVKGYGHRCRIPYSKDRLLIDFMIFHFRLLRRSVYDQVGGLNEEFIRAQDYELCLRFSEVTEITHLKKPLYYYRDHSESVSYKQRLEQILASQKAINQALERRGLSDRYELDVEILGRFAVRPKANTVKKDQ